MISSRPYTTVIITKIVANVYMESSCIFGSVCFIFSVNKL